MSKPPSRRSARAATIKSDGTLPLNGVFLPVANDKHATAKSTKPVRRTTSQTVKRPPSPISPPPKKRSRVAALPPPSKKKVVGKAKPIEDKLPAVPKEIQQLKPYFNPIPAPPEHRRPPNQLFFWGAGNFGQFGAGPDILDEFNAPKRNTWIDEKISQGTFGSEGASLETIAAGGVHSLFVDEKGTIWSFGVNDDAALGRITQGVPDPEKPGCFLDDDTLTAYPHPIQSLIDEGFRAVQLAAGDCISAAVSDGGELRVWGTFRCREGLLGFASGVPHQSLPRKILKLSHTPGDIEKVVSVAAGDNHLLVLTTHGNVFTWGSGDYGQLGRKIMDRRKIHGTVPVKVTLGRRTNRAIVIGAGKYTSFAVDEAGDVWGWGLNTMGQLGTGVAELLSEVEEIHPPRKIESLCKSALDGATIVQITGGEHHTVFLTSTGRVFTCGRCDGGQLGLGEDNDEYTSRSGSGFVAEPLEVKFEDPDDPIAFIAAGTHNNMAITRAGVLYAWGQGVQGELGVKRAEAKTPTVVVRRAGSFTATTVACGGQHTLGLFGKKPC